MIKLKKMVGQGKAEEEPEGKRIAVPSGEAVGSSGSGNTLSFWNLFISNHTVSLLYGFSFFFKN